MARQGDALENPVTGERLVFRRTTADSGGALLSFAYFLPAGGSVPLAHVHPRQEERFEIVPERVYTRPGPVAGGRPHSTMGMAAGHCVRVAFPPQGDNDTLCRAAAALSGRRNSASTTS